MRLLAITCNLIFVALIAFGVVAISSRSPADTDPEYGTPAADLTPQPVVAAYAGGLGTLIASPALLSLFALGTRRSKPVALAHAISLAGAALGGLMTALGLIMWFPPYLAHHFSDEGGAAGGILWMLGLPLLVACGVNFLALRQMRQEPD